MSHISYSLQSCSGLPICQFEGMFLGCILRYRLGIRTYTVRFTPEIMPLWTNTIIILHRPRMLCISKPVLLEEFNSLLFSSFALSAKTYSPRPFLPQLNWTFRKYRLTRESNINYTQQWSFPCANKVRINCIFVWVFVPNHAQDFTCPVKFAGNEAVWLLQSRAYKFRKISPNS